MKIIDFIPSADVSRNDILKQNLLNSTSINNLDGEIDDKLIGDFVFLGDDKLQRVPMLVEDLIPEDGVTFIPGQSGVGKTFIITYLAIMLATGKKFLNKNVISSGGIIILAAEGSATITPRLRAAAKAAGTHYDLPIVIIKDIKDLSDEKYYQEFIRKLKKYAQMIEIRFGVKVQAVIIDTITAAFSMKDENSAAETQKICTKADELGKSIGAATIVVAHYGKSQETGMRGSSARRGFGESIIAALGDRNELNGTCDNRRLVHSKNRNGEEGPIGEFDIKTMELEEDDTGKKIKAGYFVFNDTTDFRKDTKQKLRLSEADKIFMKSLNVVYSEAREIRPFEDDTKCTVKAVELGKVLHEFSSCYIANSDTEKNKTRATRVAFNRALNKAQVSNRAYYRSISNGPYIGEWIWIPGDASACSALKNEYIEYL